MAQAIPQPRSGHGPPPAAYPCGVCGIPPRGTPSQPPGERSGTDQSFNPGQKLPCLTAPGVFSGAQLFSYSQREQSREEKRGQPLTPAGQRPHTL